MKPHILFIDSDKEELTKFVEALKRVPTDDGYKCTYASNGEQALEMLRHLVPDFIVVSRQLSNLDGLGFLSAISKEPRLRATKKYLYTETESNEINMQALLVGAYGCICKTTVTPDLSNRLKEIFEVYSMPARIGHHL